MGTPKSQSKGSFSFQGIVLFANRTQLCCRTPKFGLTLGFVSKLTTSLFRHFVPYDSLWERQNDGYSVVFSLQGIVLFANRTQLRCRTPKFGLTLGFVSKLTASLFRYFVPYDSLWGRIVIKLPLRGMTCLLLCVIKYLSIFIIWRSQL